MRRMSVHALALLAALSGIAASADNVVAIRDRPRTDDEYDKLKRKAWDDGPRRLPSPEPGRYGAERIAAAQAKRERKRRFRLKQAGMLAEDAEHAAKAGES